MSEPHMFERFECAPGLRLQAHEKMAELHYANINRRLDRLEEMMERLEKRLWLTVYGVVGSFWRKRFNRFSWLFLAKCSVNFHKNKRSGQWIWTRH